jgi:hypothetical protein
MTMQKLLISSLAQTDALAQLLIEKGIITKNAFLKRLLADRATYQAILNPTPAHRHHRVQTQRRPKALLKRGS